MRTDQGGDTVSEGQAYGMLVAVGVRRRGAVPGDLVVDREPTCSATTGSWRGAGRTGRWSTPAPAADADLIAAGALVIAGRRFGDPALVADGRAISAAVLAHETVGRGDRRVLARRAVGRRPSGVVNPSYFVLGLMSVLYDAGEAGWQPVAATSRRLLDAATATPPALVPDWATIAADGGSMTARGRAGRRRATVGLRGRAGPTSSSPSTAAEGRSWRPERGRSSRPSPRTAGRSTRRTPWTGRRTTTATHPLALVAAASSAAAAGDRASADELLDRATELDEQQPTYYGAAWLAIARLWLDTDRLGGCRPGS